MKTITPLFLAAGVAASWVTSGCATFSQSPYEDGYLVYYDVMDGGAIWCWEDRLGWQYLGENEICLSRSHRPQPAHPRKPGEGEHHHHRPPHPGEKPAPGSRPCYLFFRRDGTVFSGRDGAHFNITGRFADRHQFVSHPDPVPFSGSLSGPGGRFHVSPTRTNEPRHGWGNFVDGGPRWDSGRGVSHSGTPSVESRPVRNDHGAGNRSSDHTNWSGGGSSVGNHHGGWSPSSGSSSAGGHDHYSGSSGSGGSRHSGGWASSGGGTSNSSSSSSWSGGGGSSSSSSSSGGGGSYHGSEGTSGSASSSSGGASHYGSSKDKLE